MRTLKTVIWFGLIDFSPIFGCHANGLVRCGRMRVSPNVKLDSIHIVTTSRHIVPMTWFWWKREKRSLATQLETLLWRSTPHYRLRVSKKPVLERGWDGNMICQHLRVSRVLVGTWQSIFLRKLSSRQNGLRDGSVSGTPKTGLSCQK